MKYVLILIIMAVVFGLCFLVDLLCKRIAAKRPKPQKVVRQPRRQLIFGVLMAFFAVAAAVGYFELLSWGLRIGLLIVLLMGGFLLTHYFAFGIWYDDEGFLYRDLTHRTRRYTYDQITGQSSFHTRAGITSTLFVGEDDISLSQSMVGLKDFLAKAFSRWCEAKGIDPDTVENNPAQLTYFPHRQFK